MIIYFSL